MDIGAPYGSRQKEAGGGSNTKSLSGLSKALLHNSSSLLSRERSQDMSIQNTQAQLLLPHVPTGKASSRAQAFEGQFVKVW